MSINHGVTSRQLFTTTSSTANGTESTIGFEMRYSNIDMNMVNLKLGGNIDISARNTPSILFHSNHQRIFMGSDPSDPGSTKRAAINIDHLSQNGLYIRASNQNRYGLFIHSRPNQDAFIIESGTGFNTARNFKVTGDGYVFARRYTTTLSDIPDYVFAPNYNLLPLSDLRIYLATNRHLPNIPSAAEMENTEVDLGELTRLLLEKIEENTLYILQLEERLKHVESKP